MAIRGLVGWENTEIVALTTIDMQHHILVSALVIALVIALVSRPGTVITAGTAAEETREKGAKRRETRAISTCGR
eukprot:876709-Prymnesium_polylepis.1